MENSETIINEAKRIEEDSLYSAKGHFTASQRWSKVNLLLGGMSVLLSAIAGASALSQFDNHNLMAGFLSITVAALTGIITFINPDQKASEHQLSGNKYNALKNDARIFYENEVSNQDQVQRIVSLKNLNKRRNKLNEESPIIPTWAFVQARKGIEKGEAEYKIDKI